MMIPHWILTDKSPSNSRKSLSFVNPSPFGKKFIYLIKSNNFYKIGVAKNLTDRLNNYKTHNPHELILIDFKISENYKMFERKISWKYRNKTHRGEWFLLSKSEVKSIQKEWFF